MNEATTSATEEIHNVWTIYGMDSATKEAKQPLASMGTRPQDWGHPRWTYHRFRFEWQTDPKGKPTVFHCHCWTDLKRKPNEYLSLFLPLFVYVSTTGRPSQLCGRDFLAEDDFWEKKWGKMPPIFEEEHDDFDGLDDVLLDDHGDEIEDGNEGDDFDDDFDDDELLDAPYSRQEDGIDLGPCCVCGKEDDSVRNLIALEYKAPVPGTGWGCFVCGLPADGAQAIVCDECIARDDWAEEMKYIIKGYAARKERLPIAEMSTEHFDHDYSKHPEVEVN